MSRVKICPKCGAIAEWDSYFGGTRCTRCDFVEKPKPTNADCIRTMSDEELAAWFRVIADCEGCPVTENFDECKHGKNCKDKWLEWLGQEAVQQDGGKNNGTT